MSAHKFPKQRPYAIAHRGYSAIAPENTDLAFSIAQQLGFDGVELDVHLTKDRQLVIIHDETINRTSDGRGYIKNLTMAQLQKFNFAARFKNGRARKQTILTLKQFLDRFLDQFAVINIEIKTDLIVYPEIEQLIHNLVSQYQGAAQKIIFSSFNFDSLRKMHALNQQWRLGFLWWKQAEFTKITTREIKTVCTFLHPWIDLYQQHQAQYDALALQYVFWTVNSYKSAKMFATDATVYSLISNKQF